MIAFKNFFYKLFPSIKPPESEFSKAIGTYINYHVKPMVRKQLETFEFGGTMTSNNPNKTPKVKKPKPVKK